jgi:hypothetical protein
MSEADVHSGSEAAKTHLLTLRAAATDPAISRRSWTIQCCKRHTENQKLRATKKSDVAVAVQLVVD